METLAVKLFNFISRLDLGAYYPLIVPSVVAATFLIVFISGIFFYRVKRADKTSMLAVALSLYTLSAIKTVCDLISKPIRDEFVLSCIGGLLSSALSFAFYGLLCMQHNSHFKLSSRDKRLIDRLSRSDRNNLYDKSDDGADDAGEPFVIKNALFDSPIKRVEFLPTKKYPQKGEKDFGVNYGEILSYIEKLRRHELTAEETKVIDELEKSVKLFSTREITCDERRKLSSELMRLVKLVSKYKAS